MWVGSVCIERMVGTVTEYVDAVVCRGIEANICILNMRWIEY